MQPKKKCIAKNKRSIPPKTRTLLWMACHDILPVRVSLMWHHIGSDPFCPFCLVHLEDTSDLFFVCEAFTHVWEAPFININNADQCSNFADWFRFLRNNTEANGLALARVVSWRIWFLRNQATHGLPAQVRDDIISRSLNFLAAYRAAQFPKPTWLLHLPENWTPPLGTTVKINVDTGFISMDYYQTATVVCDSTGAILWWRVRCFTGGSGLDSCSIGRDHSSSSKRVAGGLTGRCDCHQVISAISAQDGSLHFVWSFPG